MSSVMESAVKDRRKRPRELSKIALRFRSISRRGAAPVVRKAAPGVFAIRTSWITTGCRNGASIFPNSICNPSRPARRETHQRKPTGTTNGARHTTRTPRIKSDAPKRMRNLLRRIAAQCFSRKRGARKAVRWIGVLLLFRRRVLKNEMQWRARLDPLVELLLQGGFGFGQNSA